MIDIVNLPDYTTIECDLKDLPSFISERVKSHLISEEVPNICMSTRVVMGFDVYCITTHHRVIKSTVRIDRKRLEFASANKTTSILISEIFGLSHEEYKRFYNLYILSHSKKLEFTFSNKELFSKFTKEIVLSLTERQ